MFRKFRVSERFMPKGGLSSFFYRIFDVSEYRKTSKTNPYVFHRFFCIERFYEKEGGGEGRECHDFPSKFDFVSVPNHFVEEPSVFQKVSGNGNVYA